MRTRTAGAIRRRIIIHAGEPSDTQYYITGGSVSIMIEHDDRNELVLAYLNRGNFFGEMGLFESGQRTALVVAKEESEVVEMNYTKFRQLTQSDPEILFKLAAQMAGVYSRPAAGRCIWRTWTSPVASLARC